MGVHAAETTAEVGTGRLLLLVTDAEGTVTVAQAAGLPALHLDTEHAVGHPIHALLAHQPSLLEGAERALRGQAGSTTAQVGAIQLDVRYEPRFIDERLAGTAVVGMERRVPWADLTDLVAGSMQLRLEQRLRSVFSQVPGAIWFTDRSLRVVHAVGRLRAIKRGHLFTGQTIAEIVGTTDPSDPMLGSHLAVLAGERRAFRYRYRDRWYEIQLEPLLDGNGAVVGCAGVGIDITERRASELRLEQSEALLAEAQRLAHLGSWEWDVVANRLELSQELRRIHGLKLDAPADTYEAYLANVHPEDRARFDGIILGSLNERRPFDFCYRALLPGGGTRVVQARGEVQTDARGQVRRLIGTCMDVSDRVQASQRVERSLSLLRATLESTADGILVVDRGGNVAAFNTRFLALWGLSSEVMLEGRDQALLQAVLPQLESPEQFLQRVREMYERPEEEGFDTLWFKDGRVVERYSQPQRLGNEIVGRVWSFRDVTDRERLLQRTTFVADASRLLASLEVEAALQAVVDLAVPHLADACAIDLDEGSGAPRRILAHAASSGAPLPTFTPGSASARATVHDSPDGSYVTVPLHAHGRDLGALSFGSGPARCRHGADDLALAEELARRIELALENARLYRDIQDALHARDEFLSIAAHEIRGPLTAMHLAVQSLGRQAERPPNPRLLEIISREDRRLSRFVQDLLEVARARAGQLHFRIEDVDLSEAVRDVTDQLAPERQRSRSELQLDLAANVVGRWDRDRLEQVATNLLSNALKFGRGLPIRVSVSEHDGRARLEVTDQGIGVAPERQEAVFRPFERAVSARHYGGLGLGLYIVRTIVEGLGGTVALQSRPGAGTTVTVELPRARPA